MTQAHEKIHRLHDTIAAFCERHHIRKLSLFGSILRDDFRPESDIDVLVDFEPGRVPGLAFFAIQDELTSLLGHMVDLHTAGSLSKYFRDDVLTEAQVLYVAA
jgi:predicted nucleotidyltransferase